MNIFQIVIFSIISCIIVILLKSVGSELYSMVIIAAGIVVTIFIIETVGTSTVFFKELYGKWGIDGTMTSVIAKCIAISYLVEFGVGFCDDAGLKSLSDKIVLAGKVAIFALSLPILKNIFEIIDKVLAQ